MVDFCRPNSHDHLPETPARSPKTCAASALRGPEADERNSALLYHSDASKQNGERGTSAAKEIPAVEAMMMCGIPKDIGRLALDVYRSRHPGELPSDKTELFDLAFNILEKEEEKAKCIAELTARREEQKRLEASRKKDGSHDLQEDGSGPSISQPEAKPAPEPNSALPEPKIQNPVAKRITENQKQEKLLEMPKATQDTSEVKAKLKERIRKLDAENRKLQHRKLCRVCRKVELAVSGVTFLPCGHYITCESCAETLDECCACGKSIMGTVRTFLS